MPKSVAEIRFEILEFCKHLNRPGSKACFERLQFSALQGKDYKEYTRLHAERRAAEQRAAELRVHIEY
jgi:hypothetical protein